MPLHPVNLLNLKAVSHCMINFQESNTITDNLFVKNAFIVCFCLDVDKLISFKPGMMIDTTDFYTLTTE